MNPLPAFARLSTLIPLLCSAALFNIAHAADPAPGMVGKDDWLYYRYELSDSKDTASANATIDLIARLNQVLARNNVTLAVAMVPIKMRIYPEHLPADAKLTDYLAGNYDRMNKLLREKGVHTIDLNGPFLNSPQRVGENQLFFRLDTHWSPTGAALAADAIRKEIDANPALKKAWSATTEEKFSLNWGKTHNPSKARDLIPQLPKGTSQTFAPEQVLTFSLGRVQTGKDNLTGDDAAPGVSLMGSSYSDNWTGFADALRNALQRDVLDISVGAEKGTWYGMETYLRDASYQTQKPKLLIWEMPERDMKALPNYQYRDPRYLSDNTEWLLRAASWAEGTCNPSPVKVTLKSNPFASPAPAKEGDAIELEFSGPLDKLDYLSMEVISNGGRQLAIDAAGSGTRKFTFNIADDNTWHGFKVPLPATSGAGFTSAKMLPGKSRAFAIKGLQVCRHPDSLLK